MKKILFPCLFILANLSFTFSQDTLKAVKGNYTTELNINPFQGELSFNNVINQIKFRTFISENYAIRLAFNADVVKKTNDTENVYGTSPYSSDITQKATTIGLNFGFEKHLAGTKRLSPYIGAEIFYVNKSTSQHSTEVVQGRRTEKDITGAWYVYERYQQDNWGNPTYHWLYVERAYSKVGLNLLTGFDYYIAQKFYFGYEMAFGYSSLKYKDVDVTNTPITTQGNPTADSDEKEISFGAKLLNGIRLGFIF